jgi:hypothetical protein
MSTIDVARLRFRLSWGSWAAPKDVLRDAFVYVNVGSGSF